MKPAILILFLLSVSISTGALSGPVEIPDKFKGEWNSNLKNCRHDSGDGRLRIAAAHVYFHESSGPILSFHQPNPNDLVIDALLLGEGETNTTSYRFRLSSDHNRLTDITNKRNFVRYRCGANKNSPNAHK